MILLYLVFLSKVLNELEPIVKKIVAKPFMTFSHYFAWLTPVIGAIIIASPLPDDLGVGLLSASKIKKWQFILLKALR